MVSWTKGDPWTTAVNQFPKSKARLEGKYVAYSL